MNQCVETYMTFTLVPNEKLLYNQNTAGQVIAIDIEIFDWDKTTYNTTVPAVNWSNL